ncbi:MAG: biotin-dependent carboxyltransferase family protein [Janthinobacterium lividum]
MPLLEVETGGLLTTVQDLGRIGQQRSGMTVVGAMDPFAASAANLLVGNERGAAVLEITLLGPTLRFLTQARIALCGADLTARLDGELLPLWKTVTVQTGQQISFGRRRSGARSYLAVAGGFSVPAVGGSRATFLRGKLGGFEGRALRPGDILPCFSMSLSSGERGLRPGDTPVYDVPAVLCVLLGPQESQFTDEGRSAFLTATYTVSPQSDRQGYRLSGPAVERTSAADILSEPMPLGGIQIPPDGQPILLMADRQTTGGYPLIGVVISADIPHAAQLAPGDTVRFVLVRLEEAVEAAVKTERRLRLLELISLS